MKVRPLLQGAALATALLGALPACTSRCLRHTDCPSRYECALGACVMKREPADGAAVDGMTPSPSRPSPLDAATAPPARDATPHDAARNPRSPDGSSRDGARDGRARDASRDAP